MNWHAGTLVHQLLFDSNGEHLLVSTESQDTLRLLPRETEKPRRLAVLDFEARSKWRWTCFNTSVDYFMLFLDSQVKLYHPNSLTETSSCELHSQHLHTPAIEDAESNYLHVWEPVADNKFVLAGFSHSDNKALMTFLVWRNEEPQTEKRTGNTNTTILLNVQFYLGSKGSSIMFIDDALWFFHFRPAEYFS
ncbi:hypothetical protein AJ80_01951 [Polytolypa hystricis UAMH7299]|uniref:Anaphase-promoting complex subunit 4 WD40 domain-containing protein n=1 Tax=Polytolypa hystricis (strain UAMH7299) TaxID=1447883 RepID=A0A2B7Z055_POLH7|nr:hypothetical protein AJ80_01951 [Polytolypa hystricis UAMH7299]